MPDETTPIGAIGKLLTFVGAAVAIIAGWITVVCDIVLNLMGTVLDRLGDITGLAPTAASALTAGDVSFLSHAVVVPWLSFFNSFFPITEMVGLTVLAISLRVLVAIIRVCIGIYKLIPFKFT